MIRFLENEPPSLGRNLMIYRMITEWFELWAAILPKESERKRFADALLRTREEDEIIRTCCERILKKQYGVEVEKIVEVQ
jgi:hypothetical protein